MQNDDCFGAMCLEIKLFPPNIHIFYNGLAEVHGAKGRREKFCAHHTHPHGHSRNCSRETISDNELPAGRQSSYLRSLICGEGCKGATVDVGGRKDGWQLHYMRAIPNGRRVREIHSLNVRRAGKVEKLQTKINMVGSLLGGKLTCLCHFWSAANM